jgi:hypothetical protein
MNDAPWIAPKWRKRERRIVFTERDELAFGRAIRERYPTLAVIDGDRHPTPDVPLRRTIPECQNDYVTVIAPPPGWEPRVTKDGGGRYSMVPPPLSFWMQRSWWEWPDPERELGFDPPRLREGWISGSHRQGDEEDRRFLNWVWRCIAKVSLSPKVANTYNWCGLDSLRWCSRQPRRMLVGYVRPPEGWSFPEDLRYYRDELWDDSPPAGRTLRVRCTYSIVGQMGGVPAPPVPD